MQAALFGAIHLGNPSASVGGAVAIMLEAGILLTAAYALTRRLWLAWGLHVGWNYAQGSIFGIHVSGNPVSASLLSSAPTGSASLNGGAFGVEASPVAVIIGVIAGALLLRIALRRGEFVTWTAQRARIRCSRNASRR